MFAPFFIDRPVFACVLSLLILLVGGAAIMVLPIDRYPQITPPTIEISATYPGASAETVAESVAAPIEQELSGVRHLLYFDSKSSNDGSLTITATFEIGADQDLAAVEIQNRLSSAEPRLPEEVVRQGITVTKASTSILAQPQLMVELNRDTAKRMDVAISDVFPALQAYMGSLYVNDFNKFGRIWRLQLQAQAEYRDLPQDIERI